MPTERQKKVAELIVENSTLDKPLNMGQMLEKVGYSKNVIESKPGEILKSEGVREALDELGFNEKNAKTVVSEIMLNPDEESRDRLKATDQVFKVHGSYVPDKVPTTINVVLVKFLDGNDNTNTK